MEGKETKRTGKFKRLWIMFCKDKGQLAIISIFFIIAALYFTTICAGWDRGERGIKYIIEIIGIISNAAIFILIYNFISYEDIDIPGLGRFQVRKAKYDIQSLTNFISYKFFRGNLFNRNKVLESFYKDIDDDFIVRKSSDAITPLEQFPPFIALSQGSDGHFIPKRTNGTDYASNDITIETAKLDTNAIGQMEDILAAINGANITMPECGALYEIWYEYKFTGGDATDFKFEYAGTPLYLKKSKILSYDELTKVVFVAYASKGLLDENRNKTVIGIIKKDKPTFILPPELARQATRSWYREMRREEQNAV